MSGFRHPRGAIPTPAAEIDAAPSHQVSATAPPASYLMWPTHMCYWGNYGNGDCVTAEECFAKATVSPTVFVPNAKAVAWAREHGYLNGATLTSVMKTMQVSGIDIGGELYKDGGYSKVDWTDAATLQDAIFAHGPVKIGVAADEFETNKNGAVQGDSDGWTMWGYPAGLPEDHCTSLCGYGTLAELITLFAERGVTVTPVKGMPTGQCYAMFTWSGVGIIDQQSMLNMTYEAWVRNPVTITSVAK